MKKAILYTVFLLIAIGAFGQDPRFRTRQAKDWAAMVDDSIDITATPQIVDGFPGQELTITGYHSTNYLRLDDGDGLSLDGDSTCTLGQGDMIHLIYNPQVDLWIEAWRKMHSTIH